MKKLLSVLGIMAFLTTISSAAIKIRLDSNDEINGVPNATLNNKVTISSGTKGGIVTATKVTGGYGLNFSTGTIFPKIKAASADIGIIISTGSFSGASLTVSTLTVTSSTTVKNIHVTGALNLPSQSITGSYLINNTVTSTQLADNISLNNLTAIYGINTATLTVTSFASISSGTIMNLYSSTGTFTTVNVSTINITGSPVHGSIRWNPFKYAIQVSTNFYAVGYASAPYIYGNGSHLTGIVGNYAQTVVVAQARGNYTTITAALNSISDAATGKRYCIVVYPGDYSEIVTMKDYVDIIGVSKQSVSISQANANIITGANHCKLQGITVNLTAPTGAKDLYTHNGAASEVYIEDCVFNAVGTQTHTFIKFVTCSTASDVYIRNNYIIGDTTQSGYVVTVNIDTPSTLTACNRFVIEGNVTNGGFSGGFLLYGGGITNGSVNFLVKNNYLTAYGIGGSDTLIGVTLTGTHFVNITSVHNTYRGRLSVLAQSGATTTIDSFFDNIANLHKSVSGGTENLNVYGSYNTPGNSSGGDMAPGLYTAGRVNFNSAYPSTINISSHTYGLSISTNVNINGYMTTTGEISLVNNQHLSLDGINGNSYLIGRSNDMVQIYTNGTKRLEVGTSSITANASIIGTTFTGSYYLGSQTARYNFGSAADSIGYTSNDMMQFYTNSTKKFEIGTTSTTSSQRLNVTGGALISNDVFYLGSGVPINFTAFDQRIKGTTNGMLQFETGGTNNFEIGTSSINVLQNMWMNSVLYVPLNRYIEMKGTAPIYFGTPGTDSYIRGQTNNILQFYTNSTKKFEIGTTSVSFHVPLFMNGYDVMTPNIDFLVGGSPYGAILYGDSTDSLMKFHLLSNAKHTLVFGDSYYTNFIWSDQTNPTIVLRPTGSPVGQQGKWSSLSNVGTTFTINTGSQTVIGVIQINSITQLSFNKNSTVIKSTTTVGLAGTIPLSEGEIYYNSTKKSLSISTGTVLNSFDHTAMLGRQNVFTSTNTFSSGINVSTINFTGSGVKAIAYWSNAVNAVVFTSNVVIMGNLTNTSTRYVDLITNQTVYGQKRFEDQTYIGSGSPSHGTGSGNLYITNQLEIDGPSYFDYPVYFGDDIMWNYDAGATRIEDVAAWNQLAWYVGPTFGRSLIIGNGSLAAKQYDHAVQTDPTLFIQSSQDPDVDNTQWISMTHDQTNGVINVGKGNLSLSTSTALNIGSKLLFDGPSGNSYVTGQSNDMLQFYTNGTQNFEVGTSSIVAKTGRIDIVSATGGALNLGSGSYMRLSGNTNGQQLLLSLTSNFGRSLFITDDSNKNRTHIPVVTETNPILKIFSSANVQTLAGEWGSFQHDQANFVINTGTRTVTTQFKMAGTKEFEIGTSSITALQTLYTHAIDATGYEIKCATLTLTNSVLRFADDTDTYIGHVAASNIMRFYTGGSENLRLSAAQVYMPSSNLLLDSTYKLYLDGGSNTYIAYGIVPNKVDHYVGGTKMMELTAGGIDTYGFITIPSGQKLYIDSGDDTYLWEASSNLIRVVTGGVTAMSISSTYVGVDSRDFYIASGKKFYLDGLSDTYIVETSANYCEWYVGGSVKFDMSTTEVDAAVTFAPSTAGTINCGTASNYWADVSYKTLTDRGCLGSFDDGVELQDGKKVSDTEALLSIKTHPTKKTVYGVPMLDYKSFPKVSYKKADKDLYASNGEKIGSELLPRDSDDEPIGGTDGIEMTSMFSIMIGAIKELTLKYNVLQSSFTALEQRAKALEGQ